MCFACRATAARLALAKALGQIHDPATATIDTLAVIAAMELAGIALTEIVTAAEHEWLLVDSSKAPPEFYAPLAADVEDSVRHAAHHPGSGTKH